MENIKFRKEIKFIIHQSVFEELRKTLSHYLDLDPHTDVLGYKVKSLYFDTFHNKDLYDVLDGSYLKGKIRLRTYDNNSELYKIELKQKSGEDVLKRVLILSKIQALEIAEGNYNVLLDIEDSFAKSLYCKMKSEMYRPKLVIIYNRQAYLHSVNNIRITYDTRIKSNIDTTRFFDKNTNGVMSKDPMMGVLEVKYDDFLLEPIKRCLSNIQSSQMANSKYINAQLKFLL